MADLDLFAWADSRQSEPAPEAREAAEVVAFPILRHANIERIARRLVRYDERRAAFFLRQEISKLTAKRLDKGVPPEIAIRDAAALERAVWTRVGLLLHQGGGAA